jgi:hypothetical protein
MAALATDLNLISACFLTGDTAVFALCGAGARDMRAFFLIRFIHPIPHFDENIGATH